MKDTYTLIDILLFLKGQKELDFQGIKVLIEIFENDSLNDKRKRLLIITGLRELGLLDIEDSMDNSNGSKIIELKVTDLKFQNPKEIGYTAEIYEIELLNVIVGFEVFLN